MLRRMLLWACAGLSEAHRGVTFGRRSGEVRVRVLPYLRGLPDTGVSSDGPD
jgi:hypothetical protein